MRIIDIIGKKRDGLSLSDEEIHFAVHGYSAGDIADYQMSALLMAIYLQGMSLDETLALLQAMLQSGDLIDLSQVPGPKIDKHSTGGVGDKVSLVLAPLIAAAGITVPMISGRGLGHTGGTLDKLESIPGFRCSLSKTKFTAQLRRIGVAMIGQTNRLVPADKKIYALRDATATIASIPLITASILSKKLAEGATGLVLDVKFGSGAFMKDVQAARTLAENVVRTANGYGLPTSAVISSMEQPLGNAIGNWLEVQEAVQALQGRGPSDLMEITYELGAEMLRLAGSTKTRADLERIIDSGAALEKFLSLVAAQGGDQACLLKPKRYPAPKYQHPLYSQGEGYLLSIDALAVGQACVTLGGGRNQMHETIDHKAGILLWKKCGDPVHSGELLAMLYSDRKDALADAFLQLKNAFRLSETRPQPPSLIHQIFRS
ncbi:thymidine phosphorylase [bacterium]|nr:thymidine phosphorylase [bacterium]